MVPHLFFSPLVLLALVWLFVILHLTWPQPGVTAPAVPAEPKLLKPKHRRSTEPKAFDGLTKKPHCARCEQEVMLPQAPPAVPPAPMLPTHRRPREIDTSPHFCPHWGCDYRGWLGLGNLRANGHPSGGPWRGAVPMVDGSSNRLTNVRLTIATESDKMPAMPISKPDMDTATTRKPGTKLNTSR